MLILNKFIFNVFIYEKEQLVGLFNDIGNIFFIWCYYFFNNFSLGKLLEYYLENSYQDIVIYKVF